MRINTNVAALNSYNQLKNTQNNLSKSLSRLSSGKRINGAADDAAGLAISEKMNSQTKGLAQAQRNAQDGISMIQTAEGALKESHSILQRMRELAVQSANDTNTDDDRAEIQKEVDQLASELTRIGKTTEFNTQKLLDGTLDDTKFQIGANEGQNMEIAINDMRAENLGVASAEGVKNDVSYTLTSVNPTGGLGDVSFTGSADYNVAELDETTTVDADTDSNSVDANYALVDSDNNVVAVSEDGATYTALDTATAKDDLSTASDVITDDAASETYNFGEQLTEGSTVTADTVAAGDVTLSVEGSANIQFTDAKLESGEYTVVDTDHQLIDSGLGLVDSNGELVAVDGTESGNGEDNDQAWYNLEGTEIMDITNPTSGAGTNTLAADDKVTISGDGGIDVSSQNAADTAISTLDDAIANVSAERSKLGAVQNRLDHTINNLNTAEENLTAAESRISDVDMAREMMNMSKQQILSQAGTAMMAQANQLPQGVLQLLG